MQGNMKLFVRIVIITAVFMGVVGYAYYQSKDFIAGPIVLITAPTNGATVNDPFLEITGTAKNISFIALNDRQIFTDEHYIFSEKLLLYYGYNIITIGAGDQFGRVIKKTLEIVYQEQENTRNNVSSSTQRTIESQ